MTGARGARYVYMCLNMSVHINDYIRWVRASFSAVGKHICKTGSTMEDPQPSGAKTNNNFQMLVHLEQGSAKYTSEGRSSGIPTRRQIVRVPTENSALALSPTCLLLHLLRLAMATCARARVCTRVCERETGGRRESTDLSHWNPALQRRNVGKRQGALLTNSELKRSGWGKNTA